MKRKWPKTIPPPIASGESCLVVGEGDFSFSASSVREGLLDPTTLWATSFDSWEQVTEKYGERAAALKEQLVKAGARVLHSVDATQLDRTFASLASASSPRSFSSSFLATPVAEKQLSPQRAFDVVVFNFPHTGLKNVSANRRLLTGFFTSARSFLSTKQRAGDKNKFSPRAHPPRILVSIKTTAKYNHWDVVGLAQQAGLHLISIDRFECIRPSGYAHVKTKGTVAPARKAHVNTNLEEEEEEEEEEGEEGEEEEDIYYSHTRKQEVQIDFSATLAFSPQPPAVAFAFPAWYTKEQQRDKPTCSLCNSVFTTATDYAAHVTGSKHKKRQRQVETRERRKQAKAEKERRKNKPPPPKLFCKLCKTFSNSLADQRNHLEGKRHLNMLERAF